MTQSFELQEHFVPPIEDEEEKAKLRRRQSDDETSFLDQIPKYDSRPEHDKIVRVGDRRFRLSELAEVDWLRSTEGLDGFELVLGKFLPKIGKLRKKSLLFGAKYLHCRYCAVGSDFSIFAVKENLALARKHNEGAHKDLIVKESEKGHPFRFKKGNQMSPWRTQLRKNGKFVKSSQSATS
jgi:hypothetical protein